MAIARLESDRLVLEPLRVEHAEEMVAVLEDPALYRFTGGRPPTREELRRRFARQVEGRSPDGRERWLNWTVRERATGRAAGTAQATVRSDETGASADLAWVIGVRHQGQGLAKEAAATVATWLRGRGVERLAAHIHPRHEASMAVARSIGLAPTETTVGGEVQWQSQPVERSAMAFEQIGTDLTDNVLTVDPARPGRAAHAPDLRVHQAGDRRHQRAGGGDRSDHDAPDGRPPRRR